MDELMTSNIVGDVNGSSRASEEFISIVVYAIEVGDVPRKVVKACQVGAGPKNFVVLFAVVAISAAGLAWVFDGFL